MTISSVDTAHRRLLILDDDDAVGQTIALIAESMGFAVRSFTSPIAFLSAVDEWHPTHIAIDLVMPEMDGVETMRLLAECGCQANIIITSGVGGKVLDSARRAAAAQGLRIVDVLSKPFSPATLRLLLSRQSIPIVAHASHTGHKSNPFEVTEQGLRNALAQRQFQLAYQPKISCASRALAGFEALVRWAPDPSTIIMPDRFIPMMESLGLIDALTEQVFEQALRWFVMNIPSPDITLSLNISAKSLIDVHVADRLFGLCDASGVNPARVILELTESSAMEDPVNSLALLTRLRMKGCHLSIDDFGTGFSSMVQLVRLPFSEIKVDKSFVAVCSTSSEARAVTKSTVELGKSLGLRVVAEGVEDLETLEYITSIGCDFAQGYFISKPLSAEAASDWTMLTQQSVT